MPRLPPAPFVYPILDLEALGERSVGAVTAAVVKGGARMVQVRGKRCPDRTLLLATREALAAARPAGAAVIVNDRPDVVLIAGADGVHVGQDDLSPQDCRRLLGPQAIVGWSTHRLEELRAADGQPLDYVAWGPVFATATKQDAQPVVGLGSLRAARSSTTLPLVAIGGIALDNAAAVVGAGADGLAVISAVLAAPNPESAVRALCAAAAGAR